MDDKIFDELDNLDEQEAKELLDSIETTRLGDEMDKKTINRIKTSVFNKASVEMSPREKLIPNKLKFLSRCFLLAIMELTFFVLFSFVGWMDSFLSVIGIKPVVTSVLPYTLYFIIFSTFVLFIYLVMYNINSEKLNLKEFLPKNRIAIVYFFYMYISIVIRLFIFGVLLFMFDWDYSLAQLLILLPVYLIVFTSLELLLFNVKNFLIFKNPNLYYQEWQFDKKTFLLELLKHVGIICLILTIVFSLYISDTLSNNTIVSFILGFILIWFANAFFAAIVMMKKRHREETTVYTLEEIISLEAEDIKDTIDTKDTDKKPQSKRMVYIKQRGLVLGLLAIIGIYSISLLIPYIINYNAEISKPSIQSFKSQKDVTTFFSDLISPYRTNSRDNDYGELLFTLNKMFISVAKLEPRSLFSGGLHPSMKSADNMQAPEYSGTNNQVDSVDEADIVKTDGKYMYYLNGTNLFIVNSYPPEKMEVIHKKDFLIEGLYPIELFLYKEHLAVILIRNEEQANNGYSTKTIVKTYNIKDPSNPIMERNFHLDYRYLTSRMIENNLYLITSSYLRDTIDNPYYLDSSRSNSVVEIDYKDLFLMSNSNKRYSNMNVVAAFPIDKPDREAQVKAYIGGSGYDVYVSTEHIFIADTTYTPVTEAPVEDFFGCLVNDEYDLNFQKSGTSIYRIKINDGVIGDSDSAFVPGTVHNQFSMDEYKGYFRLTTQTGSWRNPSSNVYVLDENMNLCGSLEGLAPGEQIYSSRFIGDRLYLVTFKTVDPLFVIDLKDPKNPSLLGELKIPGYSEYIHPLDENHIIGFGKDTAGGNDNFSWYQGLKMAIFDITDVNNPKEKFVELIGDRGTDSELLYNHKALMYMKNLELMAFPVTLAKTEEGSDDSTFGNYVYQGAYIYNVNSSEGFKLRGRITHYEQFTESDDETCHIDRIIYANQTLYTFSGEKVKATKHKDMKDISELPLK